MVTDEDAVKCCEATEKSKEHKRLSTVYVAMKGSDFDVETRDSGAERTGEALVDRETALAKVDAVTGYGLDLASLGDTFARGSGNEFPKIRGEHKEGLATSSG